MNCRQIKLRLWEDGEVALVSRPSVKAVHNFCKTNIRQIYFYNCKDVVEENYCFLSTYSNEIKGCIGGKSFCIPCSSPEFDKQWSDRGWTLTLQLDYERGEMKWQVGTDSWTTAMPPCRPIYLVYCTGSYQSGAELLRPYLD